MNSADASLLITCDAPDEGNLEGNHGRADKHGGPSDVAHALGKVVGAFKDEPVSLKEKEEDYVDNDEVERGEDDNRLSDNPDEWSRHGDLQPLP